jgi:hypothetical protein
VVELLDVRSVDIVADPATNNGLFESQERAMKKKFKAIVESCEGTMKQPMEGMMKAYPDLQEMDVEYGDDEGDNGIGQAFKMAMMKVLDDSTLDTAGKLAKIKAILMAKEQADAAMGNSQSSDQGTMEESEKRNVANLCESLTKEVESLKSELENNKCKTLLVESNIEPTALRIKALLPLNQADRIELAKTWKPGNVATGKRPERTGSVMHESASGAYPADFKEFSRMLG